MAAIVFKTKYDYRNAEGDLDPASLKGTPADNDYLARNPDVANAVSKGLWFSSGYHHYLLHGKAEFQTGEERFKQRYYNLDLNTKASPVAKKSVMKYVLIGLGIIAAVVAYKKFGKKALKA